MTAKEKESRSSIEKKVATRNRSKKSSAVEEDELIEDRERTESEEKSMGAGTRKRGKEQY